MLFTISFRVYEVSSGRFCGKEKNELDCSPRLFPWICCLSVLMIGLSLRVFFCLLSAAMTQRWKMKWRLWLMQLRRRWLKERPNYHRPDWALSGPRACHALIKVLQKRGGSMRLCHACVWVLASGKALKKKRKKEHIVILTFPLENAPSQEQNQGKVFWFWFYLTGKCSLCFFFALFK